MTEALVSLRARAERWHEDSDVFSVPATDVLALLDRLEAAESLAQQIRNRAERAEAALEAAERERDEADGDWAEIGATQAARAEAAEARLLAAQQALREIERLAVCDKDYVFTADDSLQEIAALAVVGRVPAQEDKP